MTLRPMGLIIDESEGQLCRFAFVVPAVETVTFLGIEAVLVGIETVETLTVSAN